MRSVAVALMVAGVALFEAALDGRCDDTLPGVVFVVDDILGSKHEFEGRVGTAHWRDGYLYHRATSSHPMERTTTPSRPGQNLYTLVPGKPGGTLRRITHLRDGEVFDPEPSYDGRKILFSMRRDGEHWFNLYEINVDGTGLVQLTDGPANDVSGVYLPDGRIVFVSDRAGYLEEYHEERTEALWIINGDGRGMKQLTFNPGTVFDPTVLADGRILFSLWDTFQLNVPPADKHETYLMTVRPDGTEESHFFGAGEHLFFHRERHSGVALTQAGQLPDRTILVQTEMGPSILDISRGLGAAEALWPVFPCTTSVQLGGATHRVHLSPTGSRSTPYPLPDGRFLFSATLPGARDLGVYIADPRTRKVDLVYNAPDTAEFDPRPILWPRPRPAVLPAKEPFAEHAAKRRLEAGHGWPDVPITGRARFVVTGGRLSDVPARERALRRARYFRVVEALPTAVTTSSHTNLASRILGAVPILPDGSAYFEAPADTALFLEPLDAAGRRLEFDWQQPETSVPIGSKQIVQEMSYITAASGEVKSCHGCHTPRHLSPSPATTAMATMRRPAAIDRDVTDIVYRRNEPDEYRCVARIGEAAKYREWLGSPQADLRRRACEVLAEMEDEARKDAPAIARLLRDGSVEVRRAAAWALARLGSADLLAGLAAALEDGDWQVRFHAGAALEAVTACVPPASGDEQSKLSFYQRMARPMGGSQGVKEALGRGPPALWQFEQHDSPELHARWLEAAGRLGPRVPEAARRLIRNALDVPLPPPVTFEPYAGKRHALQSEPPPLGAIRAAGWLRDEGSVRLLIPWLSRHEYQQHAAETAVALGRIRTKDAVDALWQSLRKDVPDRRPYLNRHFQHGPRPEEYACLRGLLLANAAPSLEEVPLVIGLLPGTFLEKPRYEDRLRPESQRVLLGRVLLERANLRKRSVSLLVDVLRGEPPASDDPLYRQILSGINLERPYLEHGRPFPVVKRIEPEQALWLLGCLAVDRSEVADSLLTPYLTSDNFRARIDAAVLLDLLRFGPQTATVLAREAIQPYSFSEIASIGKGMPDPNYRDKCYLLAALAHHVPDVGALSPFVDPVRRFRDIRYGLAVGLGRRGRPDGIPLLAQLATADPIAVVRRQASESLRAIQETQLFAGKEVPPIELPEPLPFEHWYPPRGLQSPGPVVLPGSGSAPDLADIPEVLKRHIVEGLRAENYRNLNNGNNQAPGATRMMVRQIAPFCRAVSQLSAWQPAEARPLLVDLLNSPYPVAHFLSLRTLANAGGQELCENARDLGFGTVPSFVAKDFRDPRTGVNERKDGPRRPARPDDPLLVSTLTRFGDSGDTVGFYWTCEVLAVGRVKAAIPNLAAFAWMENPKGVHGPVGMGCGYPAARAIARIAGDLGHPEVGRLLGSDNMWLRAGALAGLIEARAPGIEDLLRRLLRESQPGLIHNHAATGLAQLLRKE